MRRFYTSPQNIQGNTAHLIDDAPHISRVLRMNPGDSVSVFDGSGTEYEARLTVVDSKECVAEILRSHTSSTEPKSRIRIYQGLPKGDKLDFIIQKAAELGAYSVIPTEMSRCVAKSDPKKAVQKTERRNKIATEAAKQCGRAYIPAVLPPVSFREAIGQLGDCDLALMPYEALGHAGVSSLKSVLQEHPDALDIGILIGPEGGFSDSEAEYAAENGVLQVGLGPRILRTETVALSMLSMILYEKNDL